MSQANHKMQNVNCSVFIACQLTSCIKEEFKLIHDAREEIIFENKLYQTWSNLNAASRK